MGTNAATNTENTILSTDEREQIKNHVSTVGIKMAHLAGRVNVSPGHLARTLNREREMSADLRKKLNEVLGTDY